MYKRNIFFSKLRGCKVSEFHLALAWFLGILIGVFFAGSAGTLMLPVMRSTLRSAVSIFGLLVALLLPVMFSAFAVYISFPALFLPIIFWKGFVFSFLGFGIITSFGSAGWLIRWLLMFSDGFMLVPLWWYWLEHISGQKRFSILPLSGICVIAVLIGSLDYCFISPFLVDLINM